MKNKKIIRKFTVLLAALVIMCGFSVTAYAGGGDESDDTPTPVTEETPAPETEPGQEAPAVGLSEIFSSEMGVASAAELDEEEEPPKDGDTVEEAEL